MVSSHATDAYLGTGINAPVSHRIAASRGPPPPLQRAATPSRNALLSRRNRRSRHSGQAECARGSSRRAEDQLELAFSLREHFVHLAPGVWRVEVSVVGPPAREHPPPAQPVNVRRAARQNSRHGERVARCTSCVVGGEVSTLLTVYTVYTLTASSNYSGGTCSVRVVRTRPAFDEVTVPRLP